jgi:NAD(P)-dependent dehydrogenase (short-subunit alcohol dehydrogenase family)
MADSSGPPPQTLRLRLASAFLNNAPLSRGYQPRRAARCDISAPPQCWESIIISAPRGALGRLDAKTALVTGGARGIGQAIVEKLAAEGARVTFCDIDRVNGEAAVRELAARRLEATFVPADVTREPDVARLIDEVAARCGSIDVLVNNAGVNAYFDATAMTEAEWDTVFAVDLKGAWLCSKHALVRMKQARRGSIVNIASIHARLTMSGMFPYAAAKSGLVGLTRSLALDYARENIRVNAVLPGWTRTRLVEDWFRMQPDPAAAEERILDVHPMGRLATPAEVANLVAFVASDEASAITGASFAVDCGLGVRFAT